MKKGRDSFTEMFKSFKSAEDLAKDFFNEDAKGEFLQDFEKGVKEGKPEDEAHDEFIANVNEYTVEAITSQRNKMRAAVTRWTKDHKLDLNMNKVLSDEFPQCENQGLSEDEYNRRWDPNVYYTNNYLSAAVLGGTLFTVATGGVAGVGKCVSDMNTFI